MRTIGDLLGSKPVLTTRPDQSAFEVSQTLAANNIGALPVVAGDRMVGIVSERDIIGRVVAAEANPKTTPIEVIMTKNPALVEVSQTPREALKLMNQFRCRHLPVLREGKLIGMISLRDLLQEQIAAQELELQLMSALHELEFDS